MAVTRLWDNTNPTGAQNVSTGPGYFVNHQLDIMERMLNGGVIWNNANKLIDGFHAVHADGAAGPSPDIYKSDFVTVLWAWGDTKATLAADYILDGARNIPEQTMANDVIGVDAKGAKRAIASFRIFESSPVDTLVNVRAGVYVKTGGGAVGTYAGGTLTVGAGALPLPAALNHALYAIVVDGTGTLTARKGADVVFANPATAPLVLAGDNYCGLIDIRADSIDFSLAAAGVNAFFVQDGRSDSPPIIGIGQLAQTIGASAEQANVRLSKTITTFGGVVLAIATGTHNNGVTVSLGRSGAVLTSVLNVLSGSQSPYTLIAAEAIAAGTYTYQLRDSAGSAVVKSLVVIEMPTAAIS